MGAKNIGDIKELCDICNPDMGIITAVGPQHLETFKTVENVADTKFELADCCLKKDDGKIYVNFDSEAAKTKALKIKDKNKIISFGNDDNAISATNIKVTENGTEFTLKYKDYLFPLSCKLLGKHSITNLLGAIGLALDLGVSEKQIRFAVSSLKAPPHRLELKPFINGSILIDDAYNSNPVGCLEAVNVLSSFKNRKRIIVTPGLVELGDREYEFNYNLGEAAAKGSDIIILVGQNRSKPMADAINKSDFNKEDFYIADSFSHAMSI
jgi:UDP-N-acetylmuramoyl-tripeptide--D-alanyl-D-alanine ligase